MNNSIVKLEDFELDEISGGGTAKQVAKKTAGYAIKGGLAGLLGTVSGFCAWVLCDVFGIPIYSRTNYRMATVLENVPLGYPAFFTVIGGIPAVVAGTCGWKLGKYISKKLGLED